MRHRKNDENQRTWFRSERVFRNKGKWFIRTRERVDVGPFATKAEAEVEAKSMQTALGGLNEPEKHAEAAVKSFLLDAQVPADDLSTMTDYVVKEGSL